MPTSRHAAKVGGIKANIALPYDFIADNLAINQNVIDHCIMYKSRLMAASSTCVYPAQCTRYPMHEDMVEDGPPHWSNASYATAKRAMQTAMDAAAKQYGLQGVVLYLSNMYGPHDDFNPETAHFVPALIAKMCNATGPIGLMGDGSPMREFTYVGDVAAVVVKLLTHDGPSWRNICDKWRYNVSTDESRSISEIASIVAAATGYTGKLSWSGDGCQNGTYRKNASTARLAAKGCCVDWTPLYAGVVETVKWYRENVAKESM